MARLNIRDDWWTDPRRFKLIELLGGDEQRADGIMFELWHQAQEFWKAGKRLIPLPIFMKNKYAKEVLEVDLAKHNGALIYVRGSTREFQWLIQAQATGRAAGLASGRSRRLKTEQTANKPRTNAEPSSSSSSSSSSSKIKKKRESSGDDSLPPLAVLWNQHRGKLPEVKQTNSKRTRQAALRWKENPDAEYWTSVIQKIASSKFHTGGNPRGWRAGFDFLLKPDTHIQASEGSGSFACGNNDGYSINVKPIQLEDLI